MRFGVGRLDIHCDCSWLGEECVLTAVMGPKKRELPRVACGVPKGPFWVKAALLSRRVRGSVYTSASSAGALEPGLVLSVCLACLETLVLGEIDVRGHPSLVTVGGAGGKVLGAGDFH